MNRSISQVGTTEPFLLQVSRGQVYGHSHTTKFGSNSGVTTTYAPVSAGGVYRTPQVSGATQLRVKAGGNAADTAAGAGAREVTVYGLDATGAEISEALATAGASASAPTSQSFLRAFRVIVTAAGAYATAAAGSHVGDIVIEDAAGTQDWATIDASSGFPLGQSTIACYTVPLGYSAFVRSIGVTVNSTKACDFIFFQRRNILETAAPYSAMRVVEQLQGVSGGVTSDLWVPLEFPALTDIGLMARVGSTTGSAEGNFDIVLVRD